MRGSSKKRAEAGAGLMLVMVTVGVVGIIVISIATFLGNEIESNRLVKASEARNQLFLNLRSAVGEASNLEISSRNTIPAAFLADNLRFRNCMRSDGTSCPTTVTNPGNLSEFHLFTVGNARLAGTTARPKFYTLAGEPCSDAVLVPGPDPAPSAVRDPALPAPDCVVEAVARFLVECRFLPTARATPLVDPYFNVDCPIAATGGFPAREPARVFTMVSLRQRLGGLGRNNVRGTRLFDDMPRQIRFTLDGNEPDEENFLATDNGAGLNFPFGVWNINFWNEISDDHLGKVCPPGSVNAGIERDGELICRCILGTEANVVNQADAGIGRASRLRCFTTCPAGEVLTGMDGNGRATCVPRLTGEGACRTDISLDGPTNNRIICNGNERLQTIYGFNRECVVNGANQVVCGDLKGTCCAYTDR